LRIGLLGAAFDTGNYGVSALAESAIKCILHRWPDAEITLLDSGQKVEEEKITIGNKELHIIKLPICFCKNILLENHFVVLCLYGILFKWFRSEKFRRFCARRNSALNSITQMDLVADITGGDSFSDIYGMRRFILGFLRKWLVLQFNKDLIMLPQTYGPFKSRLSRSMAKYILKRAAAVYSRDRESLEYAKDLLGNPSENGKVRLAPDVAFVLDSCRPDNQDTDSLERIRASNRILVGLNISGLLALCNLQNNVFGLKIDYLVLVNEIVELLMTSSSTATLLVPHTVSMNETDSLSDKRNWKGKGYREQPDAVVCKETYKQLSEKYRGRIFLPNEKYDHAQIKYIIGLCDFFIGARMHSCIAALSQCIPAVGLAYSKKFQGVFESVGVEDLVVDMRQQGQAEILAAIDNAFGKRQAIVERLRRAIPDVQVKVLNMFDDFEL